MKAVIMYRENNPRMVMMIAIKIYMHLWNIFSNDESSNIYCGDSLELTKWILNSGLTCHMIPKVLGFIPGPLEDMDKYGFHGIFI